MQHSPGAQQQDWSVSHEPTISQVVTFIKKGQRSGGGRPGPLLEGRVRIVKILFFAAVGRSEEHTSELQSQSNLVCRLLLEKKKSSANVRGYHLRLRLSWQRQCCDIDLSVWSQW